MPMKWRLFLPGGHVGIGRRLIVLIIVFSSLVTLFLTALQLVIDYHQQREELESDLDAIEVHVPGMAASV